MDCLFYGRYNIGDTIGSGAFGKVKVATHMLTGEKVAIKIMRKNELGEDIRRVVTEVEAQSHLIHQNICKIYEKIETKNRFYLVIEYCSGGELFDYIVQRKRLGESEARGLFRQVISAVGYVHRNGYAHRDLKPENILLSSHQAIKLIDFGLCAKNRNDGKWLETSCGSPAYAAPEIISGESYLGTRADVWSLGVILYALITGRLPFDDPNVTKMYGKILSGVFNIPHFLSKEAGDLISSMLKINPAERLTLPNICKHPWLAVEYEKDVDCDSLYSIVDLDSDCLDLMANELSCSTDALSRILKQRKMGYLTSTYMILLDRKLRKKSLKINSQADMSPNVMGDEYSALKEIEELRNISKPQTLPLRLINREIRPKKTDVFKVPPLPKKKSDVFPNEPRIVLVREPYGPATPFPHFAGPVSPFQRSSRPPGFSSPSRSVETRLEKTGFVVASPRAASVDSPRRKERDRYYDDQCTTPTRSRVIDSLEKGLNRVVEFLTPRKKPSLPVQPRKAKENYNVIMTNYVDSGLLLRKLISSARKMNLEVNDTGYFVRCLLRGKSGRITVAFDLEIMLLSDHHRAGALGVRPKRVKGNVWRYKTICFETVKTARDEWSAEIDGKDL